MDMPELYLKTLTSLLFIPYKYITFISFKQNRDREREREHRLQQSTGKVDYLCMKICLSIPN